MFFELRELNDGDVFDYCIVGTGPAGMTCALGLAQAGKKVLLLEGGGQEFTEESQDLYEGEVIGDPYIDLSDARLRFFGGSSNHWGGWCRPLDEIDFKTKPAFPKAQWPIKKSDLDPYLPRTSEILEIDPLEQDVELAGGLLKQIHFNFSPVHFADKYLERLRADETIAVAFNANLVGLETNGRAITGARAVDFEGDEKRLTARRYILATGGIENSRLLLWCNEQTSGQIVKQPQTLGRYWMDHPHFTIGEAILKQDFLPPKRDLLPPRLRRMIFGPTERTIQETGILNCGLRVESQDYEGTKKLIADLACVAPDLAEGFSELLNKGLICGTRLRAAWEQEPRSENRVALSQDRDRLGIPHPVLYWKKSGADLYTVRRTASLFGEYLAQSDLGRLRLMPWLLEEAPYPDKDELAGPHHMGGTRMADSPERGIVDRNCKVFGQDNLYIAGSSVFPSGGHANPTMTIVQLALRLVDHLCEQV